MTTQVKTKSSIKKIKIPVYGNWCGPGYGGGTPIDTLDEGCKRHDKCYSRYRNKSKCKCDKDIINYVNKYIGKMSGEQKTTAIAVRVCFKAKRKLRGCK